MLKDLPLQYESAFRFQEAQAKIEEKGCFFNRAEKARLDKLINQTNELADKNQEKDSEEKKEISEIKVEDLIEKDIVSPFNEEGFFLILVEHDTENNTKGLDFIHNMLHGSQKGCWSEADFLLMTSRPTAIHEKAQTANIQTLEKPIQANHLKQIVLQKLKTMQENKSKVEAALQQLSLSTFPIETTKMQEQEEEEKPKRKRRSRTSKKEQ